MATRMSFMFITDNSWETAPAELFLGDKSQLSKPTMTTISGSAQHKTEYSY